MGNGKNRQLAVQKAARDQGYSVAPKYIMYRGRLHEYTTGKPKTLETDSLKIAGTGTFEIKGTETGRFGVLTHG